MKNWTPDEILLLQDTSISISDLQTKLPHRSIEAIRIKSSRLGYNRTGDAFLRNSSNYLDLLHDDLFCETIDGELLGDGCVTKNKRGYHIFSYCTSNGEYAKFLHKLIANKAGSKSSLYVCPPPKSHLNPQGKLVISSTQYQFRICHKIFEHFYKRWYLPKKHIPDDLRLTPKACLHWYIGDGSIANKRSLTISLATHCFDKQELEITCSQLGALGILAKLSRYQNDQFCIQIYGKNALSFLKYIGECPVDSYQYKWNTNGYRKRRKKCFCGKWFHFFSHIDRQSYCSSSCQKHHKRCLHYKKLSNAKKGSLFHGSVKLGSQHFYYILGHTLCTGKQIAKNAISIQVLDPQLVLSMRNRLNCKQNLYNNTLSFQSKRLVGLFESLSLKWDWSKIPTKYHGDVLRGVFDAAGAINLTPDNYFQIVLRYKHASPLGEILGIQNSTLNNILRIKKSQRELVFNRMYIHSDEIRSQKKCNLFEKSLRASRKAVKKDKKGRFISSK